MKDETKKKREREREKERKKKSGGKRKGNNKKLISPDVFEFISDGCGTRRIATVGSV
jgi:DNA invertase Pin-like site-specific DNA recombinase